MHENQLSKIIVDACLKVHIAMGSGLLESVYEELLAYELRKRNLKVECQKPLPVFYDDLKMEKNEIPNRIQRPRISPTLLKPNP